MKYNIYLAEANSISHYILANGSMSFAEKIAADRPQFLAIEGNTLYATLRCPFENLAESGIASYNIEGKLQKKGETMSTMGEVACHLAVRQGEIYCPNYISGSVFKSPKTLAAHVGSSVHPIRQTSPHPHFVCTASEFILATDLGLDKIFVYDNNLTKVSSASVPSGHGARHLALSADEKTVFCVNELASTVTVFDFDNATLKICGTYPVLPCDFTGESTCAAIKTSPNGKYVYVSNRGHDSISCMKVNADKSLTLMGTTKSGGKSPRDFDVCDDYLICANETDSIVTVFKTNDANLELVQTISGAMNPQCVLIAKTCETE